MNMSQNEFTSRNPGFDKYITNLFNKMMDPDLMAGFAVTNDVVKEHAAQILHTMHATYVAKDSDYAADGKPMGNLRSSEKMGIAAWRAVLLRMNDKKSRIESFINKGSYAVQDEKVTDTLIDMAVYSLLGAVLHDEISPTTDGRVITEIDLATVTDVWLEIAFDSIKCKLYLDLGPTEEWCGDSWDMACYYFDQLVEYAYKSSELYAR